MSRFSTNGLQLFARRLCALAVSDACFSTGGRRISALTNGVVQPSLRFSAACFSSRSRRLCDLTDGSLRHFSPPAAYFSTGGCRISALTNGVARLQSSLPFVGIHSLSTLPGGGGANGHTKRLPDAHHFAVPRTNCNLGGIPSGGGGANGHTKRLPDAHHFAVPRTNCNLGGIPGQEESPSVLEELPKCRSCRIPKCPNCPSRLLPICPVCEKQFEDNKKMKAHYRDKHEKLMSAIMWIIKRILQIILIKLKIVFKLLQFLFFILSFIPFLGYGG